MSHVLLSIKSEDSGTVVQWFALSLHSKKVQTQKPPPADWGLSVWTLHVLPQSKVLTLDDMDTLNLKCKCDCVYLSIRLSTYFSLSVYWDELQQPDPEKG